MPAGVCPFVPKAYGACLWFRLDPPLVGISEDWPDLKGVLPGLELELDPHVVGPLCDGPATKVQG